jgi:hypothetical protein
MVPSPVSVSVPKDASFARYLISLIVFYNLGHGPHFPNSPSLEHATNTDRRLRHTEIGARACLAYDCLRPVSVIIMLGVCQCTDDAWTECCSHCCQDIILVLFVRKHTSTTSREVYFPLLMKRAAPSTGAHQIGQPRAISSLSPENP